MERDRHPDRHREAVQPGTARAVARAEAEVEVNQVARGGYGPPGRPIVSSRDAAQERRNLGVEVNSLTAISSARRVAGTDRGRPSPGPRSCRCPDLARPRRGGCPHRADSRVGVAGFLVGAAQRAPARRRPPVAGSVTDARMASRISARAPPSPRRRGDAGVSPDRCSEGTTAAFRAAALLSGWGASTRYAKRHSWSSMASTAVQVAVTGSSRAVGPIAPRAVRGRASSAVRSRTIVSFAVTGHRT